MRTYKEILKDIADIIDVDDESNTELTDEEKEILNNLYSEEKEKIDNYVSFMREQQSRIEHFKSEIKRLSNKIKRGENVINYLKGNLLHIMQEKGEKRLTGDVYKLSIRSFKSVHVSVPPEQLPKEYQSITVTCKPNKVLIKEHLQNGVIIDYCEILEKPSLSFDVK